MSGSRLEKGRVLRVLAGAAVGWFVGLQMRNFMELLPVAVLMLWPLGQSGSLAIAPIRWIAEAIAATGVVYPAVRLVRPDFAAERDRSYSGAMRAGLAIGLTLDLALFSLLGTRGINAPAFLAGVAAAFVLDYLRSRRSEGVGRERDRRTRVARTAAFYVGLAVTMLLIRFSPLLLGYV